MAHGGPSTVQAGPGPVAQSEAVQSKRDLTSWWKQFKRTDKKAQDQQEQQSGKPAQDTPPSRVCSESFHLPYHRPHRLARARAMAHPETIHLTRFAVAQPHGIFGVPLHTSIRYANVAISLFDEAGKSYIYGYVPIVVAKCGVFLKEKGEFSPGC